MTKTDMLFGGILLAVFTLIGMGFFTFASFSNPESRANKRGEVLLEARGLDEEPASASSCGCYELGFDLGSSHPRGTKLDLSSLNKDDPDYLENRARILAYNGNYNLCYQRLELSGARAFENGYLAGTGRIRSGRFCREGDF
ncbi:MAG: hypothetical protein AAFX52_10380 [Pseudomonadota bacterium]